jgi:hypothetical protein
MSNQTEAPAFANIDQLMRGVSVSVGRILDKALSDREVSPEEAVSSRFILLTARM